MEALPDPFRIFAVLINHSMSVLCAFAANTQARTVVTFWNWSDEAIPHTFEMEVTIMQKLSVLGDSEYHNIQDPLRSDPHIRKTVLISVAQSIFIKGFIWSFQPLQPEVVDPNQTFFLKI